MAPITFRRIAAIVAAVATLCVLASRSVAQSAENADPYKTVIVTAPSPYWGYTYSPYGDLVRAQGDFLIKREQASLLREDVRRAKLVTRRLALEHWEWERDFLAGAPNRQREREHQAKVGRSRNLPPFTEIIAAISLNDLFDELQRRPELPTAGSTAVEASCLEHVDFTVTGQGNIGLLKGEKIFWPQLLLHPDFSKEQETIDKLLSRVKQEVLVSPTYLQSNPGLLPELRRCVAVCEKRVRSWSKSDDPAWGPRHIFEAKKFLRQADQAIVILEKPDLAYYFMPLQGKTVAELVAYMKKKGIRFAPATVNCEQYYVILHRALADEVTRLLDQQPSKYP